MRVERRPYAVFALLARCKNSFGKASANFDVVGALSDGGDGTGMDSVVDIVLLRIGGSRCLAIRSRGGKRIFWRGQTECSDTCHQALEISEHRSNLKLKIKSRYNA